MSLGHIGYSYVYNILCYLHLSHFYCISPYHCSLLLYVNTVIVSLAFNNHCQLQCKCVRLITMKTPQFQSHFCRSIWYHSIVFITHVCLAISINIITMASLSFSLLWCVVLSHKRICHHHHIVWNMVKVIFIFLDYCLDVLYLKSTHFFFFLSFNGF